MALVEPTILAAGCVQISPPVLCCVTVMVKRQVAVLFLASVAVYLTVVVPIGNAPPFVKPVVALVVKITEGVEQLSVAVGAVQDAIAVVVAVVKFMLAGQAESTGGVTSVVQGLAELVTVTGCKTSQMDGHIPPAPKTVTLT